MMRREFIVGATAVVAWPIAALGQKQAMPEVGFLSPTSPDTNSGYVRAFHQALKETGYVEGENVAIVYRWAEGHLDRMPDLAAELAHRPTVSSSPQHRLRPSLLRRRPPPSPLYFLSSRTRLSLVLWQAWLGRAAILPVSIFSMPS